MRMTMDKQAMAASDNFKQPGVVDGDRMLGATLLSLVLGIWVTLVYQGMSSSPSQPIQGGSALATRVVATQVQVSEGLGARRELPLDARSSRAEARLSAPR